jgi:CTP-dependent riboflavin kinase
VVEMRAAGMTMPEIGRELGISRQRVHQMLSKMAARKKLWGLITERGQSYGLKPDEIPALFQPYMRTSELLKVMALRGKWRREENQNQ